MISLNDVLLAASNIPVDDPIAEIWGRGLQGGYKIIEYTGSLPITINANGDVLLDYRIYGADGGAGVATENLFDKNAVTKNTLISSPTGEIFSYPYYDTTGMMDIGNDFVITFVKNVSSYALSIRVAFYDIQNDFISLYHTGNAISPLNITTPTGTKKIRVSYSNGVYPGAAYPNNLFIGMTAPTSYIPYGYKLPMTVSDGNTAQTVPVYIGENQLDAIGEYKDYVDKASGKIVRCIKEYTFTGKEALPAAYGYAMRFMNPKFNDANSDTGKITCFSNFFNAIPNTTINDFNLNAPDGSIGFRRNDNEIVLKDSTKFTTPQECINYLKSQYDNGTPVKFWYVLEIPVEEDPPVPLPEIPTVDGTTVIDYDGEPKPSQMYVKYKGKG